MTIQKEAPGVWVAYCDMTGCATRLEIDCDCDDSFSEAFACLVNEHGWQYRRHTNRRGQQEHLHICKDHELRDIKELADATV